MRFLAILSTVFLLEIFSALSAPIIKANTLLLVDQFDREKIEPWNVIQNEGSEGWNHCLDVLSPARWRIEQGWMKLVVDGIDCTLTIVPPTNQQIATNDWQVDFDWRLDESVNMDRNFVWWWQDKNNWYDLKLYGTGITVQKVINGTSQPLKNNHATFPFFADQIYHFTIKYQSQKISVFINGQKIINADDQDPLQSAQKSIALKTSLGSKRSVSSFDNLQVFSLSTQVEELEVPLFKQTDQKWNNLEYDSAKLWSTNPTISRWGCALTATVMVMRYHNLTKFPDGQEITPASLNHWLQNQVDGYVGDGLLNWLAISRLSSLIHEKYGTPKLEYQRLIGTDITKQTEALANNLPLIFNITGHFLVATAYDHQSQDFSILDPYYIYRNFSQHHQELLSSRLFTPSYTNLSYLMIISPTDVDIKIKTSQNLVLEVEQFVEKIIDPVSGQETKWKITQIRKPSLGDYIFEATNSKDETSTINFYSYNQKGQVVVENLSLEKQTTEMWQLDFDPISENTNKPIPVNVENLASWNNLITQLDAHYSNPSGKFWPVFDYLLNLAREAKKSEVERQQSFKQQFTETLARTLLDSEIKAKLLEALNLINLVI